ncbi:MAG: MFS transporter [Gammaproteobacteria bacterium]|nr:MAG: MFS transporter [Gammaproteobacteria bacterium]
MHSSSSTNEVNISLDPSERNMTSIVIISIIATIGGFLFGFDSGVINGTVDGLKMAFNSESAGTGFNVASILLGCAAGAFFAGSWADTYGRRGILILAASLFILSAWGSGIATSSLEFIIYRLIGGLAIGAASIICPAYISELVPAEFRGKLSSIQQIAIISGLTAAFLSNYYLASTASHEVCAAANVALDACRAYITEHNVKGSTMPLWMDYASWRWMFWVGIIPAAIFLITLMLIPESPRFLVASGKKEKALGVLTKLYGAKAAAQTVDEIYKSIAHDHKPAFSDLIDKTKGRIRPIVWVGIGLAVLQQFVGINVVFYYGAVLWQAAGFSENDSLFINVGSGLVSIAACFITFFFVDKIGRKPLLLVGSIGMTITLALVAFAFMGAPVDANGNLVLSSSMGVTALIAANLYVIFFNLSWGPVVWIMLGEMFPNQIRGTGLAIAGFAQWIANFLITWTFPMLLASSLGLVGAYSIYAACSLFSVFFVIWWVKETKGVKLEEMEG